MLNFTPEKAYSLIMSTNGIRGASYLPNKEIRDRENRPELTAFITDKMMARANEIYSKARSPQDSPYDGELPEYYFDTHATTMDSDPTHNKALE